MAVYWLGVVGSRRRTDRAHVEARVRAEVARLRVETGRRVGVVSGGCRGVDTWAAELAEAEGWPVAVIPPELSNLPREAGRLAYTLRYYERNTLIAEQAATLLAFVAPERKGGTEHTVREAEARGKRVLVDTGEPAAAATEATGNG